MYGIRQELSKELSAAELAAFGPSDDSQPASSTTDCYPRPGQASGAEHRAGSETASEDEAEEHGMFADPPRGVRPAEGA